MKPPTSSVRDLGKAIKKLRLESGLTQQRLADSSGLDIRYVGSIERGQRNPTFGALQGIASVFRMKASELLRRANL
jgi:transcriptional regulator with XRE-family HTH domain